MDAGNTLDNESIRLLRDHVARLERQIINLRRLVGSRPRFVTTPGAKQARFIEFALSEALATTDASASASVDDWWDGANPDPTSAGITVYNKTASSNYIFEGDSGDKGIARWDFHDEKWRIVQMECP